MSTFLDSKYEQDLPDILISWYWYFPGINCASCRGKQLSQGEAQNALLDACGWCSSLPEETCQLQWGLFPHWFLWWSAKWLLSCFTNQDDLWWFLRFLHHGPCHFKPTVSSGVSLGTMFSGAVLVSNTKNLQFSATLILAKFSYP